MSETTTSEIARLRERIASEYQAANRIFADFTPTARHRFITKRQEAIAGCVEELKQYMSPQEALAILAETLDTMPEKVIQQDILTLLRHELDKSEETEQLLDWIQDMWETWQILVERFGVETAYKILLAPVSFPDCKMAGS